MNKTGEKLFFYQKVIVNPSTSVKQFADGWNGNEQISSDYKGITEKKVEPKWLHPGTTLQGGAVFSLIIMFLDFMQMLLGAYEVHALYVQGVLAKLFFSVYALTDLGF